MYCSCPLFLVSKKDSLSIWTVENLYYLTHWQRSNKKTAKERETRIYSVFLWSFSRKLSIFLNNESFIALPAAKNLNSSLIRFAHVLISSKVGLGHRFGEVIMGMRLAQMTNVAFVFDSEVWKRQGIHGKNEMVPLWSPSPPQYRGDFVWYKNRKELNWRTVKD